MRPTALLARVFLLRALATWVLARLFASAALFLAAIDPLRLTPTQTMLIIAATLALGMVDVKRRHERALLENLGMTRPTLAALLAGPAMIGELTIMLTARAMLSS